MTIEPPSRRALVWETRFVMAAFLVPSVIAAVVRLVQSAAGYGTASRFASIVPNPVLNMILGMAEYMALAAVVPIALFLLQRTGQPPRAIGMGMFTFGDDILPGIGLAAMAFLAEIVLAGVMSPLFERERHLIEQVPVGHVPAYYVIWGLVMAATTAVTEEVLVNGYLLTRLSQLGWAPNPALVLSLALRTSYHVYYGLGFVLTIPFGYFVTRSFQKHGRLNRPIAAHFIFDATLLTIGILTS